jgi:hypothetical protein
VDDNGTPERPSWRELARTRWRRAAIDTTDDSEDGGPFAVVQGCEPRSVVLCKTALEALSVMRERCTNAGYCYMKHRVVRMRWDGKRRLMTTRLIERARQLDKRLLRRYRRFGNS